MERIQDRANRDVMRGKPFALQVLPARSKRPYAGDDDPCGGAAVPLPNFFFESLASDASPYKSVKQKLPMTVEEGMKIESLAATTREIQNLIYWVIVTLANKYEEAVPDLAKRDPVLNRLFLSLSRSMTHLSYKTAALKTFLQFLMREFYLPFLSHRFTSEDKKELLSCKLEDCFLQ